MIDTVLQKLIEFVETASPFLWETLYRQVYVEVFQYLLWVLLMLALIFASYKLFRYSEMRKKEDEYSDWEIGVWISVVFMVGLPIISLSILSEMISRLINPNFYAIQLILGTIK